MKKNYFLLIAALVIAAFSVNAQNLVLNNDFENWTGGTADNWLADGGAIEITQNSTTTQSGSFSCEVLWTSQDNQYLTSDSFIVTSGIEMNASLWVYDNDIAGRARLCIIYEGADNYYGDYSADMDSWQQITYSDIIPEGATSAQFQIRFYDISGDWDGDATVIVDNVVYEGNSTINPEPTNYPTDFVATAEGLAIMLNWTDAVGDDLPYAYLIKAEQAVEASPTIVIPVDGIPEADDFDFSDGMGAANVSYGNENFTFTGLETGEYYHFWIYPYSNSGENIDYKTDGEAPNVGAETADFTIINQENFDAGLGTWTPYNVIGDQEWYQDEYGGDTYAKMSGYDGSAFDNEDWLISPPLNLTIYDSVFFNFKSAFNYTGPDLELYISTDYDGVGNPNDYTWTDISDMVQWSDGSWNWVESGKIDLKDYFQSNTFLGFKFTSTTEGSSTWELDSFLIYGYLETGINNNQDVSISVYPNPVTDVVNIETAVEGLLEIYSVNGQLLINKVVTEGINSINVGNLMQGAYLLKFSDVNGNSATKKLLIR